MYNKLSWGKYEYSLGLMLMEINISMQHLEDGLEGLEGELEIYSNEDCNTIRRLQCVRQTLFEKERLQ